MKNNDKIVKTVNVYETTDYSKFIILPGNRKVDKAHSRSLQRSMLTYGNRLDDNPIEVNKNFEVLDGQHSLDAARELNFPVCYVIRQNANVNDIRIENTNRKNWNWYDYAVSYRDNDKNINYKQFLDLIDNFHQSFRITMQYTGFGSHGEDNNGAGVFIAGDFVMSDYGHAQDLLQKYQEISAAAGTHNREFAAACYAYLKKPTYNHEIMLAKVATHKRLLAGSFFTSDYIANLQEIWKA